MILVLFLKLMSGISNRSQYCADRTAIHTRTRPIMKVTKLGKMNHSSPMTLIRLGKLKSMTFSIRFPTTFNYFGPCPKIIDFVTFYQPFHQGITLEAIM